jgi:hypothetical protein
MPGCVLRASGKTFDVDAFLKGSDFKPSVVYRKGQRRKPASRGSQVSSGFNLTVSNSDEPKRQVDDALAFVRDNREELLRLGRFGGVDDVILDFAIAQREFVAHSAELPAELLTLAGSLGIDIHVSSYLVT